MALPYAPEGYYRAPQNNISELIMRQGDIAARRAEQNARIWGGAIQDIGNVAGQAITQHAEQKAISKRDAAWTDYVSSGEWQADPKKAYAYSVKIWGPHEGPKQFQALQDVQKIGHGDPAADQAALGNVAARLDKMDEAGIARAWPLVTPLFKKVYGRDLPAQYTPELRPQIKDFITLYGPEAKKRETAVVKGALVDTQTGESIYEAPPEVKEPPKRSLFDILNDPNVPEVDKQKAIVAERQASAAGRDPNSGSGEEDRRLDHGYEFNSRQLEQIRKPLMDQAARFDRLRDAVDAGSAQADSLIAPELLIVMAGGQGTGLRINEAEIKRVVGGRSTVEDFKAQVQKVRDGKSVTDETRQQIRALMRTVQGKIMARATLLDDANGRLVSAKSVDDQRGIMADLRSKLTAVSAGSGDQGGEQIIATRDGKKWKRQPDGSMVEVP